MQNPPLDPDVADDAPTAPILTGYDEEHLITYLRLLDVETNGADWKEVARIVLHLDPDREPDRARRAWKTHLARAHWMAEHGYRHLLRGGGTALTRHPTRCPTPDSVFVRSPRAARGRRPGPARHGA